MDELVYEIGMALVVITIVLCEFGFVYWLRVEKSMREDLEDLEDQDA